MFLKNKEIDSTSIYLTYTTYTLASLSFILVIILRAVEVVAYKATVFHLMISNFGKCVKAYFLKLVNGNFYTSKFFNTIYDCTHYTLSVYYILTHKQ